MIYKHEKILHDCCMALFTIGLIGVGFHVGLSSLADVPTQHTGTQTYRMVAR
jgi:hypothetical protein